MFVLPPPWKQNSYVEILTLKVMLFWGGAFGRRLGNEHRVLTNGISSLKKRDPAGSLTPFTYSEKVVCSEEADPYQRRNLPVPDLGFVASGTVSDKCCLQSALSMAFSYSSPKGLRGQFKVLDPFLVLRQLVSYTVYTQILEI